MKDCIEWEDIVEEYTPEIEEWEDFIFKVSFYGENDDPMFDDPEYKEERWASDILNEE